MSITSSIHSYIATLPVYTCASDRTITLEYACSALHMCMSFPFAMKGFDALRYNRKRGELKSHCYTAWLVQLLNTTMHIAWMQRVASMLRYSGCHEITKTCYSSYTTSYCHHVSSYPLFKHNRFAFAVWLTSGYGQWSNLLYSYDWASHRSWHSYMFYIVMVWLVSWRSFRRWTTVSRDSKKKRRDVAQVIGDLQVIVRQYRNSRTAVSRTAILGGMTFFIT